MADGWYGYCQCGERFPKYEVKIPNSQEFSGLREYFALINITINNNTTINNYNSEELFLGDYDNDSLVVFDDDVRNQIFCTSLRGSHSQLGLMVTELYKDEFYCTENKQWYHFVGHTWKSTLAEIDLNTLLSSNEFTRYFYMAKKYYETLDIQDDSTKKKVNHISKLIQDLGNDGFKTKIMSQAGMEICKTNRAFEEKLNCLDAMAFSNGVYDFSTMSFRNGIPEDTLSKSTIHNYVQYDPENTKVKFVMKFLSDILPDPNVLHYTLKVLALGLTLNTSKQFFWILTGKGGNGKSKLMSFLKKCIGDYYSVADPSFLTQRIPPASQPNEALAALQYARLCVISEAGMFRNYSVWFDENFNR